MPKVSDTERQALEAGTTGFDREFFTGKPNWELLRKIPPTVLSKEEQDFLDGPTEHICKMINDWDVRGVKHDVPKEIWDYLQNNNFFGLRVSKKHGGKGFSAQAQSIIFGKIASRSLDVSIIVEVANSLGPDELIEKYGTEQQKNKHLEEFKSGKVIPCFAITSAEGGSDIGAMQDYGIVKKGVHDGKEVIGISLTWSKRYITLAPKATTITLAFRLFDPENLLGGQKNRGITLALIPTSHPGVNIGRRHLPSGSAFPNGPLSGSDVFVPLSWIIGGEKQIGNGWKMSMEALTAGRGISLPSMSTSGIKLMLRTSTAYTKIRRQFHRSISTVEGIKEKLVSLVESAYLIESGRSVAASMIDYENRPLVIASILKYQSTEHARQSAINAIDIHGGKGLIDGPSNYLQSAYQIAPIGVTVEGSNILTRSLIIMGQAIFRSHPYFAREIFALESNGNDGLAEFDSAISSHTKTLLVNFVLSFFHNITLGKFVSNNRINGELRNWYKNLSHASRNFAFIADILIITYRGSLKKRQYMSGRLSDALSELFLLSSVLKRYEDDGSIDEDRPVLELCMQNGLYRFQSTLNKIIGNQPNIILRVFLKIVILPYGITYKPASDKLMSSVASIVTKPSGTRDRLTRHLYIPSSIDEPLGLLEHTFLEVTKHEKLIEEFEMMSQNYFSYENMFEMSLNSNKLTKIEVNNLKEIEELVSRVVSVDDFDKSEISGVNS